MNIHFPDTLLDLILSFSHTNKHPSSHIVQPTNVSSPTHSFTTGPMQNLGTPFKKSPPRFHLLDRSSSSPSSAVSYGYGNDLPPLPSLSSPLNHSSSYQSMESPSLHNNTPKKSLWVSTEQGMYSHIPTLPIYNIVHCSLFFGHFIDWLIVFVPLFIHSF